MKKETLFKIIAISIPFLLILFIEMGLRVIGYGESYPLFHKVTTENKPDYLVMNPYIGRKYFKDKKFLSDNQFDLFLREKTDSTFRIFVQGASTAVGFPYYRGGSFPRMLKHRLSQTFPEKNIEVVNTGITAVNSYTLWDLTDEIIAQKPDVVIIYAGHNEYYGALGVGSSTGLGSHPFFIRVYLSLKDLRLFQLLDNTYTHIRSSNTAKPGIGETTLMEVMVREQRIPLYSGLYHAGIEQFENNLKRILAKYKDNNIPVILSTLVSNEKDVKPFISDTIKDEASFRKALESNGAEANNIARRNARAAYVLGRHYLHTNPDTAKKYLHLAKELDFLRFRAPEAINEVITKLAREHHVSLIDMKDDFLAHSPKNVIGDELMTDHVHPNVMGYFLMADAFYEEIKKLNLQQPWDNYISFEEAFQDKPITEIDSIKGQLVIEDLKKSWPYDLRMSGARAPAPYFIENATYEQRKALDLYTKVATWKDVMIQSLDVYDREEAHKKALRVAQSLILEYPEEAQIYDLAGEICLKQGDFAKAAYYLSKYHQLDRSILSTQKLATVYLKLGKAELAQKVLLEAKNRNFKDEVLDGLLNETNGLLR